MNENLIYDIGMHNGDDTAYYLSLGYNVIAIEASPDLVEKGKLRFQQEIADKRLEILNVGIASKSDFMDFYLNKANSVWNSFDKEIGERGGLGFEIIKIRTTGLDEIIGDKGLPYYMKIDIEGNDILCLMSLTGSKEKPKYISAEVNDISILNKLYELGYRKFKLIDQFKFLPLELPATREFKIYKKHYFFSHSMNFFVRASRKLFEKYVNRYCLAQYRKLFNYDHAQGSSGPFGEGLPGRWVDYEQLLKVYQFYKTSFENSRRFGGFNFWIDIHATN